MTFRVALVGCGTIARRAHLPAFRRLDGVDVVAFASRSIASAEAARDEWGSGDVVADWSELLERDDVDAIDVCAPNAQHAPIAIAAARAGKHVLVEKPLAPTVAEVDAMIDAAEQAGVVLVPAHNVRLLPPFVAMADAVRDGAAGEVLGVRAAFGHAGPEQWAPGATWFFDRVAAGGGALLDLGVHVADLVRAVTGREVTQVAAATSGARGEVEAAGLLLLRLDNGAIGSLHASWSAVPGPDHQLTVFGSRGTLHLDTRTAPVLRTAGGDEVELPLPPGDDPCAVFVAAARDGGPPAVTAHDGRAAVAIVAAGYESARTGCAVDVDGG